MRSMPLKILIITAGSISTIMNLIAVFVSFNGTESIYHINLSKPQNISARLVNAATALAGRIAAVVLYF